jgi:hypothetical protein
MGIVVIEILAGPGVGETFEFDRDQILVGRGSQCQMQVASPHVSRQQCELTRQGDQVVLENLGSVNVTYLNDRPIDRVYVQDGDLITFCDVALRVRLPRAGAEAAGPDPDRTVAYPQGHVPPGVGAGAPPPQPPQPPQPTQHQPPQHQPPQQPPPQQHYQPPPQPPPQQQRPAGRGGEPTAPPGPLPPPGARPQPPPPPIQRGSPAGVGMGTGLHSVMPPMQPGPNIAGPGQPPPGGSGQHPAYGQRPPGPPPGMPPGAPHGLPPGMPPGAPQGMPGAPPGMPQGARPGMPSPGSSGLISARRRKKKPGGEAKGGPGKPVNVQLVRNIVVGLAAVMVLMMLTTFVIEKSSSGDDTGNELPEAATPPPETIVTSTRGDRTDEEIVRDAESAFQTASTYLRQHRIADENLSISIENYRQSKAELAIVDPAKWPGWTSEIDPQLEEAEGLLDQKWKDAKLNYIRFYQSSDYDRALQELERILRLVPDKNDSRNDYARTRIRAVRDIMSGGKKKGRWDNHR